MKSRDTTAYRSVYAIRCKANGKMYIGSSVNPETRIKTHFSELKNKLMKGLDNCYLGSTKESKERNLAFLTDYKTYGIEGFEFYILERDLPYYESFEREQYYTLLYRTNEVDFGYNRAAGNRIVPKSFEIIEGLPPKKD